MTELSRVQWESALDQATPPTFGELVTVLEDADMVEATPEELIEDAVEEDVLVEDEDYHLRLNVPVPDPEDPQSLDEDLGGDPEKTVGEQVDKYRQVFLAAAERVGREPWEFVEETAIREAFSAIGFEKLLDNGALFETRHWRWIAVSDDEEPQRRRWYYPSEEEPKPTEFRRFDELLRENAPDDYTPHYFKVAKASKDPATQYGSWKDDDARLTVNEAVEWMEEGGNVGIAGRPDGPLVNVDIDDDEATSPDDVPSSLRARSRSRTGWHTWYFDERGDVPNIPTDEYGEIRTNWQYVVAPGSFVASTSEEIPESAEAPGYYTVEDEKPVASVKFDDLPDVFHDAHEEIEAAEEEAADAHDESRTFDYDGQGSAVFDTEASNLLTQSHAPIDRFPSIFHGSSTGANMSVSGGKLHCWRHNVAHGGLQALAVLSEVVAGGCQAIGAPHKNSGAGPNRLKGDWRLIWGAWHEAKNRQLIPQNDPIPYKALRGVAVDDGLVERDELVERDADTGKVIEDLETHNGDTYLALPPGSYNDAIEHIEDEYGFDPGRSESSPAGGRPTYNDLLETALSDDFVTEDELTPRRSTSGEVYQSLPAHAYERTVRYLDAEGRDTGRLTRLDADSPYHEVDLTEYVGSNPYGDPETMLAACLTARDDGAVAENASPPRLALVAIIRETTGREQRGPIREGTRELAEAVYDEDLDVSHVNEHDKVTIP